MLLKTKLDNIKSCLNSDNVLANLEERYCYATDASNTRSEYKIPDLVVFVTSIEDVQKTLRYAYENNIPVIARGAGTNMVGACVCTQGGIVLNFSRMNKILDISPSGRTITVQPGAVLGDIKKAVEQFGLFFPPDPSNFKVSTIGGAIAQSSGGALAFKYGTIKDYVLSLKVVTSNGDLLTLGTTTSKNSAGYHLGQLIVGSEGTLAIVVEAVLKLIPKPEHKVTFISYFNEISDAVKAVDNIILNNIFPSAIDFMDNNTLKTVEDFAHYGIKTDFEYAILMDLDGSKDELEMQAKSVNEILISNRASYVEVAYSEDDSEKIWSARRASFSAATRLAPDVISDDIIVPRKNLAEMILKCKQIASKYNLNLCMVGHLGDGNIHPQFVLDLDDEIQFRNYTSARAEMYKLASELDGAVSAEHGIGLEKIAYLENTLDSNVLGLMKQIKKVFDPKNILNPNKIINM